MTLTAEENQNLEDMLATIEAEMGALSEWERNFIKDQLERHAKYGADMRLSPKQWGVIRRVYANVTGGGSGEDESE